jgi:TonB-dependent starch-binding outer membrane protein SusC
MINFTTSKLKAGALVFFLWAVAIGEASAQELFAQQTTNTGVSQSKNAKEKKKISIRAENVSLAEVLRLIERQSQFFFIYADEEVNATDKMTVAIEKEEIKSLLDELLTPLEIQYQIYGDQIVLHRKKPSGNDNKELLAGEPTPQIEGTANDQSNQELTSLTTVSLAPIAFSVKGKVIDENSAALPGVNVIEKGTTNGTVTDADGAFSINVENENAVLVFSYIGYAQQEVALNGQSSLSVSLVPDIKSLSEVVVIGYGEQKRSDLTGSIASVKSEDIKNLPVASVADALQGRVAGIFVTPSSGQPGSTPNITLRGPANINGVGPLYVVDGMPFFGTGFNFNVQDIESMEVIKDASAAAIYGAQGSGGVILITTKKGSSQRIKVGFNASYGLREAFNLPQLLNRDEYIRAKIASGVPASRYGDPADYGNLPNTDWFDELYNTGVEQNYTAYLSGGGDKSTFYASMNYQGLQGIKIDNTLERYTLRLNSEHKLNKKLKFGQTLFGSFTAENPPTTPNEGPLGFRNTPLVPVYDPTNPVGGWGRDFESQRGNAVGSEYSDYRRNESYTINAAVYLEWQIIKNLKFRTNGGVNLVNNNDYFFDYAYNFGAVQRAIERFGRKFSNRRDILVNYTLTYDRTFGNHDFKILAGYEARRGKYADIEGDYNNPLSVLAQNSQLSSSATPNKLAFSGRDNFRILSQFGRLDYSYAGKYLAQFNVRRDGVATVFGPENKFGVFPSMSLGWKISEEAFMQPISQVSNLKLRLSYGSLGNYQGLREFLFANDYSRGFVFDPGSGSTTVGVGISSKLPNRDIRWESILTANAGLDLGLFGNKLNISLDYYNRTTEDMIYQVPLPPTAGLGESVFYNVGELKNTGLEIFTEYRESIGDFKFSVGINGAFNRNELVSLSSDIKDQQIISGFINGAYSGAAPSRSVPGESLGQFYGYLSDGIYSADEPTGPTVNNASPKAGDLIYRDVVPDGIINDRDRVFIGNPWPKFTYGITLGGDWKGIDIRLFFTGVQGVDIYNGTATYENMFFNDFNSTNKIFTTSGFEGQGVTNVPSATLRNWTQVSSYHVQNGSYLRLKNLQIGYTLPPSLLSKAKISSARIFFMTDNLFTLTSYKGIDPESALSGPVTNEFPVGQTTARGIDNSNFRYPLSRLFSIGLNIEF